MNRRFQWLEAETPVTQDLELIPLFLIYEKNKQGRTSHKAVIIDCINTQMNNINGKINIMRLEKKL
jgi:hypothetical protein